MTIAGCYLSPEGVVLGADSTSSAPISPGPGQFGYHYFNYNQKLFELGESSSIGLLTWGLGGLPHKSYRTLLAEVADGLADQAPGDIQGVVDSFVDALWAEYTTGLDSEIKRCAQLAQKSACGSGGTDDRTTQEEEEFAGLRWNLVVGFCIGGYLPSDRTPAAFQVILDPLAGKPAADSLKPGTYNFWGAPNPIKRLIFGSDDDLKSSIIASGKWTGTEQELTSLLEQQVWGHPLLPIREAVDFVHSCIYSTIKAMKFSNLFQICGGPIELAVITSDRKFRWVKHKPWDAAITEG